MQHHILTLAHKLPQLYHHLLEPLLDVEFPEETLATCNNCNLCRSPQSTYINTKCCTYHPHLANYLIGGVLVDQSLAEGQKRIQAQIAAKVGVTPYGIIPSLEYKRREKLFKEQKSDFFKGAREVYDSVRCPYYDQGNCSVWKYRENLCVTHFCSSIGGSKGKFFWKKLNDYLILVEETLAKYTLLELGWPAEAISAGGMRSKNLHLENDENQVDAKQYSELWREWQGREASLYIHAYEIVQGLSPETFAPLLGLDGQILETAIQQLAPGFRAAIVPDYLQLHPEVKTIASSKPNYILLLRGPEQSEIPQVLLPLIKAFNGQRSTLEVFDLAYRILYNPSPIMDELLNKGILVRA